MAKRIIEMVRAKKAAMKKDPYEATQNAAMAIAAVHGGIRSAAWRNYMMQFVEQNPRGTPVDPKQLERLLGTDGTLGDPELDMHRAYLVGNGPCGPTTPLTFDQGVDSIDQDLDGDCLSKEPVDTTRPPRKPGKPGKYKRKSR